MTKWLPVLVLALLTPVQGLALLLQATGPNWASWNSKPVGSSAGSVSTLNGTPVGSATGALISWNGLHLPGSAAASTFSETFASGSTPCWAGGPSSCTQVWANYPGTATTQSIVAAPSSGWDNTKVIKIPANSKKPLFFYTIGTIPYAPAGTLSGDVTVEFSYDSSRFPQKGVFWLNASTDGAPVYYLSLDGSGNCLMGRSQWVPCAVNQRHLLHIHLAGQSSYDQLDGGNQYPFTADNTDPFDEVALDGSTVTNLYFGDIAISFNGYKSCLASSQALFDGQGERQRYGGKSERRNARWEFQ